MNVYLLKIVVAATLKRVETFANVDRAEMKMVMIGSAGVSPASRHRRMTGSNPALSRYKAAGETPALRPSIGARTTAAPNFGSQLLR